MAHLQDSWGACLCSCSSRMINRALHMGSWQLLPKSAFGSQPQAFQRKALPSVPSGARPVYHHEDPGQLIACQVPWGWVATEVLTAA